MKNPNKVDSPSKKKVAQTSVNAPATKGTLKANLQKKEFLLYGILTFEQAVIKQLLHLW